MADANENPSLETLTEADRQLRKIAEGLANDPKTRSAYLRLIKQKFPEEVIPELEVEEKIAAMAKPHIDKVAELEKKLLEREVNDNINRQRAALRDQGYTEDDIKAIEKKMVEEKIPSHDTAAKYYRMERETAAPTPAAVSMVNKIPVAHKDIKEAGGIKNWARNEASNAVADIKSGRVKLH